jgi:hypothetical protein
MEPENLLLSSKEPERGFYQPDKPSSTSSPLRSILILFSHLSLGLPSGLLFSDIPTKTFYAFLFCTKLRRGAGGRDRATAYGMQDRRNGIRVPVRFKIVPFPSNPDWLWSPHSLLSDWY